MSFIRLLLLLAFCPGRRPLRLCQWPLSFPHSVSPICPLVSAHGCLLCSNPHLSCSCGGTRSMSSFARWHCFLYKQIGSCLFFLILYLFRCFLIVSGWSIVFRLLLLYSDLLQMKFVPCPQDTNSYLALCLCLGTSFLHLKCPFYFSLRRALLTMFRNSHKLLCL